MKILKLLPIPAIIFTTLYIFAMVFLKWGLEFDVNIILFSGGAMVGLILLDVFDVLFPEITISPRTIIGEVVFIVLSLFVITSSGSIVGSGVVLSLFLRILIEQVGEFITTKGISSWFTRAHLDPSPSIEQVVLWGGVVLFIIETYIFYSVV